MYLKKNHPYNPGYAIPKDVLNEGPYAKITPGLPRGTGRGTFIGPMPRLPRGTTLYKNQSIFAADKRKSALSGYGGNFRGAMGRSKYGSLGSLVGDACGCGGKCAPCNTNGYYSLGADCPPNAPPGTTGCVAVSSPTSGMVASTTTSGNTVYRGTATDAAGYYAQMVAAGQTSVTIPNYTLTSAEQSKYNSTKISLNVALQGPLLAGSYPFLSLDNGYVAAWGASTHTLKIYKMGKDILEAFTGAIGDLVSAVSNALKNLGCMALPYAQITAAVTANPSLPASTIARNLCSAGSGQQQVIMPPETSGTNWMLIGGAALIGTFLFLRK